MLKLNSIEEIIRHQRYQLGDVIEYDNFVRFDGEYTISYKFDDILEELEELL